MRGLWIGFAAGAATAAALPTLMPFIAEIARPVSKAAIKHGLLGLDRMRTQVARASESIEDLVAEIRAEVVAELAKRPANDAASERGSQVAPSSNGQGATTPSHG